MKTIITTLPIYDKIEKQCYERSKHSGNGIVPTLTPRHRLPSFQWKDGTDGAATVSKIEMINKDGETYYRNLFDHWVNTSFDTFVSSGLDIISAINTDGGNDSAAVHKSFYPTYSIKSPIGTVITLTGFLTLNSGFAPVIDILYNNAVVSTISLTAGLNIINYTSPGALEIAFGIRADLGNCNFSFTNVKIGYANIDSYFPVLPASYAITGDVYFQYKGDTLNYLLPIGEYYLKITMNTGHVYYSEWFKVDCVYENLITGFTNNGYESFTSLGTAITSAVNSAGNADTSSSSVFQVTKNKPITVIFYLTKISGTLPEIYLTNNSVSTTVVNAVEGLNIITLTPTWTGDSYIRFYNNATNVNFATSEILVNKGYSEKYLIIDFHNTCDLGEILYHDGFTQTLWFESETMEPSFPLEEEGQKNGEGRFVRTFARQTKKYLVRTKNMPDYMVDVFHRLRLHDTITLTDLVGDTNTVYNLEVEHDWLFDDKYYAKLDLIFDYDETVVLSGCCSNIV